MDKEKAQGILSITSARNIMRSQEVGSDGFYHFFGRKASNESNIRSNIDVLRNSVAKFIAENMANDLKDENLRLHHFMDNGWHCVSSNYLVLKSEFTLAVEDAFAEVRKSKRGAAITKVKVPLDLKVFHEMNTAYKSRMRYKDAIIGGTVGIYITHPEASKCAEIINNVIKYSDDFVETVKSDEILESKMRLMRPKLMGICMGLVRSDGSEVDTSTVFSVLNAKLWNSLKSLSHRRDTQITRFKATLLDENHEKDSGERLLKAISDRYTRWYMERIFRLISNLSIVREAFWRKSQDPTGNKLVHLGLLAARNMDPMAYKAASVPCPLPDSFVSGSSLMVEIMPEFSAFAAKCKNLGNRAFDEEHGILKESEDLLEKFSNFETISNNIRKDLSSYLKMIKAKK